MAWVLVIVAGLLEVGWAIGLKYSDAFTRPIPSVLTVLAIVSSLFLLSVAIKDLPIGTAYAVWVGVGAAGAAIFGMILFGEPRSPARLFFLALLIISVMGLQMTSGGPPSGSATAAERETRPR